MDLVFEKAIAFGFKRLRLNNSSLVVFHCVPGAGKSSFIRDLITTDPRFVAYTFGIPDQSSLVARIKSHSEYSSEDTEGKIVIVDEYLEGDYLSLRPRLVFGDPCQSPPETPVLRPDFICRETKRFGKNTCEFLWRLGYQISSEKEDEVTLADIFVGEPIGQVIAFEKEIKDLLTAHSCEFLDICQIRGRTFESVTFVTALEVPVLGQEHLYFQALTRHTKSLVVLSPNATFAAP